MPFLYTQLSLELIFILTFTEFFRPISNLIKFLSFQIKRALFKLSSTIYMTFETNSISTSALSYFLKDYMLLDLARSPHFGTRDYGEVITIQPFSVKIVYTKPDELSQKFKNLIYNKIDVSVLNLALSTSLIGFEDAIFVVNRVRAIFDVL